MIDTNPVKGRNGSVAFWRGLWSLLLGAAFLWVPGMGPLFWVAARWWEGSLPAKDLQRRLNAERAQATPLEKTVPPEMKWLGGKSPVRPLLNG